MTQRLRQHNLTKRRARELPVTALRYATMWAFAVHRQFERLKGSLDTDDEAGLLLDAVQYVTCLRNLLRSAYLVRDVLYPFDSDETEAWLYQFEKKCPQVVRARDFLEHFDEYALGVGRLQIQKGSSAPLRIRFESDGTGMRLVLVAARRRVVIDLEKTTEAAGELWIGLALANDIADELRTVNERNAAEYYEAYADEYAAFFARAGLPKTKESQRRPVRLKPPPVQVSQPQQK